MKELSYIFFTFLKLGATAFGGYMSLVALVQRQVVDIDKKLKEEDLLDGISFTSVLPGPFAVNVCTYVGYRLKGISGAATAFIGIIFPSFLLVVLLSYLYFIYGNIPVVKSIFYGITPAIIALIITVAVGMTRKNINDYTQWILCITAALLLVFIGGFAITFLLIVGSGLAGYFLFRKSISPDNTVSADRQVLNRKEIIISGLFILLLLGLLFWNGFTQSAPIQVQILTSFSGLSLTLFGGGYVVIPALHELFVENLGWLTPNEFADGIAIGQITPGPIFIAATFIGYKMAAIPGAILATVGMFTPPAILTVILSRFVGWLTHSAGIQAAMKGVRPAVIGMIFASAVSIGKTMVFSIPTVAIFFVVLFLSFKYNMSPVYLILGSGAAGLIIL